MPKRSKPFSLIPIVLVAALFSVPAIGQVVQEKSECWAVTNLKGYSGHSDKNYSFEEDGIKANMLLCFEGNSGTATGTDTKLMRFGESTLAGMVQKDGLELFEVYQIDRVNNKLLYSKSRIGTKTVYPFLPDIILSIVGDAKKVTK